MKILLPIDDTPCSAAALDTVIKQFPASGSEVRLLNVVEWPHNLPMYLAMGQGRSAGDDLLGSRDRAFRAGEIVLSRAAERLRAAGFRTTKVIVTGTARDVIVDAAREWTPDLIVIGSHGWHGVDRWLLGSVSDAVVRQVACSVLVVREPGHREAGTREPEPAVSSTG